MFDCSLCCTPAFMLPAHPGTIQAPEQVRPEPKYRARGLRPGASGHSLRATLIRFSGAPTSLGDLLRLSSAPTRLLIVAGLLGDVLLRGQGCLASQVYYPGRQSRCASRRRRP